MECPICLMICRSVVTLRGITAIHCGHSICTLCYLDLVQHHQCPRCPQCRRYIVKNKPSEPNPYTVWPVKPPNAYWKMVSWLCC
jgi:hypothetical protein